MKLSEIQTDYRALILGQSGTGKTHLVGTLAEIMPTVIVTADPQGLVTLRRQPILPETEIIIIESWANIWDYYVQVSKFSESHLAIALDDFGSVQESARRRLDKEPRTDKENRMSKAEADSTIRSQLMLGDRRLRIQDWGSLWLGMENFLCDILKLPYRVKLVTVLEAEAENPRDETDHILPALQGSLRTSILARFGLVGEAFVSYDNQDRETYCLHCRAHPRIETKTRYGEGRTWTNPTVSRLIAHIKGGRTDVGETELEKRIGVGIKKEKGG